MLAVRGADRASSVRPIPLTDRRLSVSRSLPATTPSHSYNHSVRRNVSSLRYSRADGHHVRFSVVSGDTLRNAKADLEAHRGLIVRVAGYCDYFCNLSGTLQDEAVACTEHTGT